MTEFGKSDALERARFTGANLAGARFVDSTLRGARFRAADLSEVVMRGIEIREAEIDSPWLPEGNNVLTVNGVDVIPYVEAELDRRFPGRGQRHADTPDGLRSAWDALQRTWAATLDRAAAMPEGAVDESVAEEWSFAQTLRHLVLATDMWLGRGILQREQPFHRFGLMDVGSDDEPGMDMSVFATEQPSYAQVLEARADRVRLVRDFLATVTPEQLAESRPNPHAPEYAETTLSCLHTILDEEWEHHRYAVRDLDALDARAAEAGTTTDG